MKRLLITSILAVAPMFAGNALIDGRIAHVTEHPTARKVWYASIAAAFAGQALDCASSTGWGYETNPMLRGANGQFSPVRGYSIKLGLVGGLVAAEAITSRHGDHYKLFTTVNSIVAGEGTIAAVHNFKLKGKQ